MPHAIADSDDDGDDIDIFVGDQNDGGRDALGLGANVKTTEGAIECYDGTNEKSTGSTERLKRQVLSAERRLMTNSAPVAMSAAQQSSPSLRTQKRRHTTVFDSEPVGGAEKSVKRTKTLKTYGAKRASQVIDDGGFERLRDEGLAPVTSQSVRFSEHSGFHSSAGLPEGLLGSGFMNHEPMVMFKDSGSTVADSSSAQQRMIEQALGNKNAPNTSGVNELHADEQSSSSFPWSASEQTRSAKSTAKRDHGSLDGTRISANAEDSTTIKTDLNQDSATDRCASNAEGNQQVDDKMIDEIRVKPSPAASPSVHLHSPANRQPSPVVEVSQKRNKVITASPSVLDGTQRSTRGRKKKVDDDHITDPPSSDDKAIGLPKERYQPRPSRRRATAVAEDPIDFSVRPEKAAKAKRTKTTNAETSFTTLVPELDVTPAASLGANGNAGKPFAKGSQEKASQDATSSHNKTEDSCVDKNDRSAENETNEKGDELSFVDVKFAPPTDVQKNDDHIFVKPALPTPKANPASKSKRSHTTIFEDHVEFTSSQRSPSLREQQTKRESALQDVHNDALRPSHRKRKTIVDDDEEDELVKDPGEGSAKEDSPPKKRTRGRPAKSTARPPAKSAEKVLEDSEDGVGDDSDQEIMPKKRGRGRPSKTAAELSPKRTREHTAKAPNELSKPAPVAAASIESEARNPKGAVANTTTVDSLVEEHTPSPTKIVAKPAATPHKTAKASPTTHSPIKSLAGVPLRVGLSKRHRIPPLLRTMKPPKR